MLTILEIFVALFCKSHVRGTRAAWFVCEHVYRCLTLRGWERGPPFAFTCAEIFLCQRCKLINGFYDFQAIFSQSSSPKLMVNIYNLSNSVSGIALLVLLDALKFLRNIGNYTSNPHHLKWIGLGVLAASL